VIPVYTGHVTVRHDELDRFGRLQPAAYLRYLAHVAVEASAAAGYDAAWYLANGTHWIVRRSTFMLPHPVTADERLAIRTWVEDFRRVRSHRRYEVRGNDGRLCLEGRCDWVYVDRATGRPRRVPPAMEAAFGAAAGSAERAPWRAPPAPVAPAVGTHRVRLCEIDPVGHVNNAAYLDIVAQAALDALEAAGWSLDRMIETGGVPLVAGADLEHLAGARYGDRLEIATWFRPAPGALDAHQRVVLAGTDRPLLNATTRWRWVDPARGGRVALPADMLPALRPLLAA
jgi:acyl-CoA thioester hydrolase